MAANPARGQLNRENDVMFSLAPFVAEDLVSDKNTSFFREENVGHGLFSHVVIILHPTRLTRSDDREQQLLRSH